MTWALEVALPEIGRLADRRDYAAAFRIAQEAAEADPHQPPAGRAVAGDLGGAVDRDQRARRGDTLQGIRRRRRRLAPPGPLAHQQRPSSPGPQAMANREAGIPDHRGRRIAGIGRPRLAIHAGQRGQPSFGHGAGARRNVPHLGSRDSITSCRLSLDDFLIDRYEVTNREFAEFVAGGGYRKPEYWKHPFAKEGRTVGWQEAVAEFRDSTGRPGPATWELGTYPSGQDDFPVTGVSWYEAAAYAEFAGKTLPTIYHWNRVAWTIAGRARFVSHRPVEQLWCSGTRPGRKAPGNEPSRDLRPRRKRQGMGLERRRSARRHPLHPGRRLDRAHLHVQRPGRSEPVQPAAHLWAPLRQAPLRRPEPRCKGRSSSASSATTAGRNPLPTRPSASIAASTCTTRPTWGPPSSLADASPPYWKLEKVTFNAAYGNERMRAYLFLPKKGLCLRPIRQSCSFLVRGALRERSEKHTSGGRTSGFHGEKRPGRHLPRLQVHLRAG